MKTRRGHVNISTWQRVTILVTVTLALASMPVVSLLTAHPSDLNAAIFVKSFHDLPMTYTMEGVKIEIASVAKMDKGVSVYARAWQDGKQIGFGPTGETDLEHFVFRHIDPNIILDNGTTKRDPGKVLKRALYETMVVSGRKDTQVVAGSVGSTTSTFYPDPDPESSSVDGYTERVYTAGNTFTAIRGTCTGSDDLSTAITVELEADTTTNTYDYLRRGFFVFDTASIGDSDTISSATFSVYVTSKVSTLGGSIAVVPASPSDTSITTYDHNNSIGTTDLATRKTISSMSSSAYNNFTLNSTGLAQISKTVRSKFGMRVSWDVDNIAPTWSSNAGATINIASAEYSGTSFAPKLVVVHSAPAPTVSGANPSSREQNTSNQNLIVSGTNFITGATSSFSGTGITVNSTTFSSSTQLTINIDVASNATTGLRDFTIHNADGQNVTCSNCFTVQAGSPTVTAPSPNNKSQNVSSQNITLTGTYFQSGATSSVSGTGVTVNSTTYVSATELTLNINVASDATTGVRNITVYNPDGKTGSCTGCFTVNAGAPTVTSANPASGVQGATALSVTLTGTYFQNGATSSVSGTGVTVNSTTYTSATELTLSLDIAAGATVSARNITVYNPDGQQGSCASCFNVIAPAPTVSSVYPAFKTQNSSGASLTVTGTNFQNGAAASFSGTGITVNSTTFVSATELTVSVDIAAGATTGDRNITITNPDAQGASCNNCFTVTPEGSTNINSVSPNHWAWNELTNWIDFYNTASVQVIGSIVKGYASSSLGYISFDCATSPRGNICSQSDYKVVNDGNGNLSGWAWNDTIGWISFCGGQGSANCPGSVSYRVLVDTTSGTFCDSASYTDCYAWNDSVGWISFNCKPHDGETCNVDYNVDSSWSAVATTGTVVSAIFDTGIPGGASLTSLFWRGTLPTNTSVSFQIAASNSADGPWTYVGSDGTASSWYTPAAANTPVSLDYSLHTGRYFRYKMRLTSDTGQTSSPRVEEVFLVWGR